MALHVLALTKIRASICRSHIRASADISWDIKCSGIS